MSLKHLFLSRMDNHEYPQVLGSQSVTPVPDT